MRTPLATTIALFVLALPASALAETPVEDTYSNTPGDPGGSVPFTGVEVGLVVLVGAALLLMGFAMWRATRPRLDS